MDKPNIIVILSDDQGAWAMCCAGNSEIRTPNLDRLALGGIRFDEFFCTSPVCSPARASIVTGRMPSQHGVHDWLRAGDTIEKYEPDREGELIEYLKGQPMYTDFLADAGYVCGLSGKWHLGNSHKAQASYSYWNVHAKGGSNYYKAPMVNGDDVYEEESYVTDVITDHALEFLDQRTGDQPFYLGVHYTAPHSPWGRDQHPKGTYDEYLANCPFESTPTEQEHAWSNHCLYPRSTEHRKEILAGYFTAITEMDRNIGRIIDWLEEKGLRDNTLILFTGDNGMNMGHHGLYGKGNASSPMNMYDSSVKVPAIMNWPAEIEQGRTSSAMLSHYDLMPTLLEITGCVNPNADTLPGKSFVPIMRGETDSVRDDVVLFDEYGPVRMIRSDSWKYVHRYPYGPHELYDLRTDPGECYNLADTPEFQEQIAEMRSRLEQWFLTYSNPSVDGRAEPVTGSGQLGLAGVHGDGRCNYHC